VVCVCVCVCVCTHTHILYTYVHTHTQTHTHSLTHSHTHTHIHTGVRDPQTRPSGYGTLFSGLHCGYYSPLFSCVWGPGWFQRIENPPSGYGSSIMNNRMIFFIEWVFLIQCTMTLTIIHNRLLFIIDYCSSLGCAASTTRNILLFLCFCKFS